MKKSIIFALFLASFICSAHATPTITIYADGTQIGSVIRRLPIISATITDSAGININRSSISLNIDGAIVYPSITPTSTEATTFEATYKVTSALGKGSHIITVSAANTQTQETSATATPTVLAEVNITVNPMNYPNPFKPKHSESTKITYTLSDDGDISIFIFDITGTLVKKLTCAAGEQDSSGTGLGGRQGYNEAAWDGKAFSGNLLGNGVYPYFIIYNGSVIGSSQSAIYD